LTANGMASIRCKVIRHGPAKNRTSAAINECISNQTTPKSHPEKQVRAVVRIKEKRRYD